MQLKSIGRVLAIALLPITGAGCDITEPSGTGDVREKAHMAQQIVERYLALTGDSDLRVVLLEGSPFAAVEGYFSPSVADVYETLGAAVPFTSGYMEELGGLGLDEAQILDFLAPERRVDELGSAALLETGRTVVDLDDPLFFEHWASALSRSDAWETREEELGYRFTGLQIGAPVEFIEEGLVLVPFTTLCGQGCGSGHIAVFSVSPLVPPALSEVRTAWVGYL